MVYGKPLFRNLAVNVPVADCGLLKAGPKCFGGLVGHVVLHGFVDEPAALSRLGQAVHGLDRGLWKHNVETFVHRFRG